MTQSLISTPSSSTTLEKAQAATRRLGEWYVFTATPDMPLAGNVVTPRHIHGGNIVPAVELAERRLDADGVLVEVPKVVAGVTTADCLPVVIANEERAVVLHVSRKTLIHGLLDNVTTYIEPTVMDHVWVGPHVCEYHFAFEHEGPEVKAFRYRFPEAVHFHKGKIYLSLKKALGQYLRQWQVHPERVVYDGRCTFEKVELPSYRRWMAEGKPGELQQLTTVVWREDVAG